MEYQTDPESRPDSDFVPGQLQHLIAGNKGRLLDQRRTPGQILRIDLTHGLFYWTVTAFEDKGACWEIPFEDVGSFQFERQSQTLAPSALWEYKQVVAQFDKRLEIIASSSSKEQTELSVQKQMSLIPSLIDLAALTVESLQALKSIKDAIQTEFSHWMSTDELQAIENSTASSLVSNPYSGEWLKHLSISLAELGLVDYRGKAPRNLPNIPSSSQFKLYAIRRIAFLRFLFLQNSLLHVFLYRGSSSHSQWRTLSKTFSSWSFDLQVAKDLAELEADNDAVISYIFKRRFSVEELFMTYLETKQMSQRYDEQEVLAFYRPESGVF